MTSATPLALMAALGLFLHCATKPDWPSEPTSMKERVV